ncbi:MAG: hypothetical protein QGG24_07350 [Vicinamibacterales bacterium]|jgi:hypothetical protein|nr:hypothetical protein [Acidobacteriota bacterium]MDP7295121.1 hypothetical protein [Vicinamibacterales bacterium]MDP7471531.1 hypothetical protein [Vicinamibacterales bacterium]MDP7671758.1 hypothetical protein [Vicinamibacterales bacterium]HJO39805.1 hypothetical protein [Vicinamibacterales bacterium]
MRLNHLAARLLVLSVPIGACGGSSAPDAEPTGGSGAPESSAAPSASTYPGAYRDLGLPEYPDAELADTGRQTTSLRDGLRLSLRTAESVADAAAFYEERLVADGWSAPPNRMAGGQLIIRAFTKDNLTYQPPSAPTPTAARRSGSACSSGSGEDRLIRYFRSPSSRSRSRTLTPSVIHAGASSPLR